jgi:transcriptional regulator with XRE-family HTH domain
MAGRSSLSPQPPSLVGIFIREKREALSLSQRALGQKFEPTVTTQFISNIERGVTPLPPSHVSTVANALGFDRCELFSVMVREYSARIRREAGDPDLAADDADSCYIYDVCQAYREADPAIRAEFEKICERMLNVPCPGAKVGR